MTCSHDPNLNIMLTFFDCTSVVILQKDYDTEVRLSKEAALKRSTGAAAAPAPSFAESAKDTLLIKLYEDLTNLAVPIIKIKEGGAGQEVTFVCVQTVDGRSTSTRYVLMSHR